MTTTAGMGRWFTVFCLVMVVAGVVLTHNGVQDLRVAGMTAFGASWLSFSVLAYYRRLTLQRAQSMPPPSDTDPPE
ncbi:MAG: hypothetical protein OXE50_04470 [Chloroflexi bacterium]|nr:hypothetical protein [Chloroflexota bacterium]